MSRKHFSWLAGLTVLAAVVAFLVPSQTSHDEGFEQAPLLPGLEAQVNEIDWLRVSAQGEVLATARRVEGSWVIDEAGGYIADWPRLHALLSALAAAQVVEPKTANPEYYSRLGVDDPTSPDASGVLVEFAESTGLPAVIAGNAAQGREGQYARLPGNAQSLLIDRELDIPRSTVDWLDRGIIDISDQEVVEVAVTHADGQSVVISKVSADDANFELQGIPEGMEPQSTWAVNSLAGGLSSLDLEAVVPEGELDWGEATRFRLVTADGLNVDAELLTVPSEDGGETEHWLRLQAGLYTTAIGGFDESAAGETASRADTIKQRVSGWAYRIPEHKFEAMNKRMEDLVKETETTE